MGCYKLQKKINVTLEFRYRNVNVNRLSVTQMTILNKMDNSVILLNIKNMK